MTVADPSLSPMMSQWHACKARAQDALLLFRMGDFYEAFYDDAVILSRELELTLTKRQDIPMSGIPHHTSEGYIDRLVAKGYRVAVAEQVEDAARAKGLVKREVVRIVTPGTLVHSQLLSEKTNNFFVSLTQTGSLFGLAALDLSTGCFFVSEYRDIRELLNEVYRLRPAEFLISERFQRHHVSLFEELRLTYSFLVTPQPDWQFDLSLAQESLVQHFKVYHLEGFGLGEMGPAIAAAGALLRYIQHTLCLSVDHIQELLPYTTSQFMMLDRMTQRNLELTRSLQDGSRRHTLLEVLDHTETPMGGRLLHHWIKQPLFSLPEIHARQKGIQSLLDNSNTLNHLKATLPQVRDIERLVSKIHSGYATPRDLFALQTSFPAIATVKALCRSLDSPWIAAQEEQLSPFPELHARLASALVDDPPARLGEGRTFRTGFHPELDALYEMNRDSKAWIAQYQTQLREETGIKSLKVGFNRMFGYYIEVSRGQSERMPDRFQRRQTLVNAERYLSPELKDYENKILTADERLRSLEAGLFQELRQAVTAESKHLLGVARAIAQLDCLISLAHVARIYHYCCPVVDESDILLIEGGRHPVIEQVFKQEPFIPNDTLLETGKERLLLITGPNMAGKSTYLRQTALIFILAQMGSFVPVQKAHLGLIDKLFTRIGAGDDLSRGQSTFMVEMTETAHILHQVTSRSLVILDEIGRGTSTYDGISLAWSIAEYLLTTPHRLAKTLFATHYWELTQLEGKVPGAVNYHVAVHETEGRMTFLRKIIKGGTDKSYGIQVARLAGVPLSIIQRAEEILNQLERNSPRQRPLHLPPHKRSSIPEKEGSAVHQLLLFSEKSNAL